MHVRWKLQGSKSRPDHVATRGGGVILKETDFFHIFIWKNNLLHKLAQEPPCSCTLNILYCTYTQQFTAYGWTKV